MDYLTVGHIVKTIGLKGQVKVYPTTNFRDSRFKSKSHLFVYNKDTDERRELTIRQRHPSGNVEEIFFNEIKSIEEAELLVGKELQVIKDYKFLTKDEYFYSDLIGLKALFDNGESIGEVSRVEEYAKYATLRIKTDKKDVLVPFVNAFIKNVDLEKGEIIINFMEGLL